MSEKSRKPDEELQNLMNALADSIADAPDKEILAEDEMTVTDANVAAERVRNLLGAAFKEHQQRLLKGARKQYEFRVAEVRQRTYDLPATPEKRRALLFSILARIPEVRSALLTAQHREFESLTDADVDGLLMQLKALGVTVERNEQE